MARKRMVTRTIPITAVTALCVDKTQNTAGNVRVEVLGRHNVTDKKLPKLVEEAIGKDYIRVAEIVVAQLQARRYEMSEAEFFRQATEVKNQ